MITHYRTNLLFLWLLMATSSIVFIEPAPYDILCLGLLAMFFYFGLRIPAQMSTATIILGVYLLATIISSALAYEPADSFRSLAVRFYLLASWLLFTCVVFENPDRVTRILFSGYIVAAVIAVTFGVLGYYKLVPYTEQLLEFGRVRSTFKDPNVYGPFLVPVVMYLLARFEDTTRVKSIFLGGLFAYLVFGVVISYSRGSWLSLFVAISIYFFMRLAVSRSEEDKKQLMIKGGVLIFLSVIILGWLSTTEGIKQMIERRTAVQYYDVQEDRGRFSTQKLVLERSLLEPLGIGAGQSEKEYHFSVAPHNVYLFVLIETGWIGALAFISFLGLTLWKALRFLRFSLDIQPIYTAIFASFVGLLVQSFFVDSLHWRHMYLLAGMLWGQALAFEAYMQSRNQNPGFIRSAAP